MTPGDLARLHAACFTLPRPWTEAEFAALAAQPGSLLLTVPHGFLLGRVMADEAELLTLAIAPSVRRSGHGRALVRQFLSAIAAQGAKTAFLEVAADNAPALSLYRQTGWTEAGRRRNYYAAGLDALVMRHDTACL